MEKIKSDRKLFRKLRKLRKISLRTWDDSTIMEALTGTREGEWLWKKTQRKVTGKGKNCGGDPQKNRQKRVDRVYCRGSYHCDYHGTDGLLQ